MIHLICLNPALDRTMIIEDFQASKPNRPIQVRDFPGGKSFNVAYAIQQEYPTTDFMVHTLLGGAIGNYVATLAEQRNITLNVVDTNNLTRTCSIIFDTVTHQVFPIYERGIGVTEEIVDSVTQNLLESISDGDSIIFSGSFMPGFPTNYIQKIINKLKMKNVFVGVDTSGKALQNAYFAKPQLIKINDEELLDIFPEFKGELVEDYVELIRTHVNDLTEYFIITLGKNGLIAKMQDKLFHVIANPIKAKNPIASGDFFLGVLVSSLVNQTSSEQAVKRAIAFSTANCLNLFPEVDMNVVNDIANSQLGIKYYDLYE